MLNSKFIPIVILLILSVFTKAQTNPKLIKADKLFIINDFESAASEYENYLSKNPKDYYASKQAALCYNYLNIQNKAIDHWPNVIDNAQATDVDKLFYGKCLLANYRIEDAKKIFISLKNSSNKEAANWAKAYENFQFYEDSALTKVIPLKNLNTLKPDFAPAFYLNKMVYLTEKKTSGFVKFFSSWFTSTYFVIKQADKIDSITFSSSKDYNKQIQSKLNHGPLSFTSNDSVIYFTKSASKKENKKLKNGTIRMQIFTSKLNKFGDVHPEIMPFQHNSMAYDCMHPAINKKGNRLYFSSDMPGGFGGYDLYYCEKQNETWGKPINLGDKINTSGNELFPNLTTEDGLYFASDVLPGLGGLDLFYSDFNPIKKEYTEPENLGATINTQFDDFGSYINKDGKTGYLTSNRKNGMRDDDIYFFRNNKPSYYNAKLKFIDSTTQLPVSMNFTLSNLNLNVQDKTDTLNPFNIRLKAGKDLNLIAESANYKPVNYTKKLTEQDTLIIITCKTKSEKSIKGKVIDKETNLPLAGVKVAIYDEFGNNYLNIVTDSTGDYKVINLPVEKALFIGSEKRPDYFSNTEKFVIKPDSDIVKNIYTQKIVVGKSIKVENIYFDVAKWNIKSDAAIELDKLVQLMKDNPDIIIELSSHTDCRGKASANLALSDKRAKSSASYIISKGIAKTRIKGKGYGESKLLNSCACEGKVNSTCSENEHAQNRRTEIKVTGFLKK